MEALIILFTPNSFLFSFQEYIPPASPEGIAGTWTVSSTTELLQVHYNFLRGKVQVLLADAQACQGIS